VDSTCTIHWLSGCCCSCTWNGLTQHVTLAPSWPFFKARLKTHLFSLSFQWLQSALKPTLISLYTLTVCSLHYYNMHAIHNRFVYFRAWLRAYRCSLLFFLDRPIDVLPMCCSCLTIMPDVFFLRSSVKILYTEQLVANNNMMSEMCSRQVAWKPGCLPLWVNKQPNISQVLVGMLMMILLLIYRWFWTSQCGVFWKLFFSAFGEVTAWPESGIFMTGDVNSPVL